MINVTTFLDANSCRLDKPVYYSIDRGIRYNSRDILGIISHLGRKLMNLGIKKGDRVIIYLNNSPEYLFSFLALWRIGAVAVPTNRIYTIPELKYYLEDSGAKLIITDEEIPELDVDSYIVVCKTFHHD